MSSAQEVDYRTQNGAVLWQIPRFGRPIKEETDEVYGIVTRTLKGKYAVGNNSEERHAETTAIYLGLFEGIDPSRSLLFGLWVACPQCAYAIVDSGIKVVITNFDYINNATPSDWRPKVAEGLKILHSHGIFVLNNPLSDINRTVLMRNVNLSVANGKTYRHPSIFNPFCRKEDQ